MTEMEKAQKRTADVLYLLDFIKERYGYDEAKEALEEIVDQDPEFLNIWMFVQQNDY